MLVEEFLAVETGTAPQTGEGLDVWVHFRRAGINEYSIRKTKEDTIRNSKIFWLSGIQDKRVMEIDVLKKF